MTFPLDLADPAALGLDVVQLDKLCARIERDIARGDHPGAQLAVARHGKLALFRSFGQARLDPPAAADADTLFLLYSNTKVITAAALWMLAEDGALRFGDRIADLLPGFGRNRKGEITVIQLLTHQAGFPSAPLPSEIWADHARVREAVCNFTLDWQPGTRVEYHPGAAHWVAAMLIEELAGQDFREFIRARVILPLGLGDELYVGVPEAVLPRCADMHEVTPARGMAAMTAERSPSYRAAGRPGGGGYATARAMTAFYQMLVQGGRLGDTRVLSPRTIAYVTRNFTGDRIDLASGMTAHRGLGPTSRGHTDLARSIGTLAHPRTFGHGGAGSSYCWGDPESGVSFAYLSNAKLDDDAHAARMDGLSNFVHAAILD